MHLDIKQKIRIGCRKDKTIESCGFIVVGRDQKVKMVECDNIHTDPENFFKVSAAKYLDVKLKNKIIASYHSHVRSGAQPSSYDEDMFEEMCLPYYIYSIIEDSFFLGFPDSYNPPPLKGRIYAQDIFQCSTLVKDYFQIEWGEKINKWLENWSIPHNPKIANELMITTFNKNAREIKKEDMKEGDIIIFDINPKKMYHMGVCLGENELLHQPVDSLSSTTLMDERWLSKVYKVYRNTEL